MTSRARATRLLAGALALVSLAGCSARSGSPPRLSSGYVSHIVCSYVFVSGLTTGGAPGLAWLTAAYSLGYLVGFITPFLPGGLGAREGTVVAVLVARYGIGVATTLALAIRLANTLGELVACGILEAVYLGARRLPLVLRRSRDRVALSMLAARLRIGPDPIARCHRAAVARSNETGGRA